MNLHEYQAKEILRHYGIPVPPARVAKTPDEAFEAARSLGGEKFVVKAQIHAGGRGKAGGVLLVSSQEEVRTAAGKILARRLKTPQTGPDGQPCGQVLVQIQTEIAKEFYASVVLDRSQARPCVIFSPAGGMEIEEAAKRTPEAIWKKHFSPRSGLSLKEAREFLCDRRGEACLAPADAVESLADILCKLSKIFLETDASLVEINPLAQTPTGEFLAVDAKIRLDDNGLEKHPELARLRDPAQEDPRENEAKKFDLSYVGLDGNIGCMVNGAGLAMATMDLIKLAGGEPSNFLDVGGGASKEKVAAAFKIILKDPKVQAILVNIFGGIMRCDVIAEGILAAIKEVGLDAGARSPRPQGGGTPPRHLVVRLEGTQSEQGKQILAQSNLNIISVSSLEEAAKKAVGAAQKIHPSPPPPTGTAPLPSPLFPPKGVADPPLAEEEREG